MKGKMSVPLHHAQPLQGVTTAIGCGEIVAPAASEKAGFADSAKNTWIKGHPGPKIGDRFLTLNRRLA